MADGVQIAAILLVVGPLVGLLGFYDTRLYRIWRASREEHLAAVARHRRGWVALNVGFGAATVGTATGLVVLVASADASGAAAALLALGTAGYALGGVSWCVVLAIRTRTTPLLAEMVASSRPTEPAESLLGAAIGGVFMGFVLATGLALCGLGIGLAMGPVVSPVVGWGIAASGALVIAWLARTGDVIPAVLYVPTLVLGVVLLLGGGV